MSFPIIGPSSRAYEDWNSRGVNLRFKGRPSAIIPVTSIEALTDALQYTVNTGQQLAVRSGGHCLENFVNNPSVKILIDISRMKGIRFDAVMNAIEVQAGNTLGELYETLFTNWGTVLPAGEYPGVGMGGHIPGGAFGFLCRQHGLGVDHLYAVEVLCVNRERQVETVIATREAGDPYRDLWWAHTGGGAGNFGIVTRYWFRTPDVTSTDPTQLLPAAPAVVETLEIEWYWQDIQENIFHQLVANFGAWCAAHAHPDDKGNTLFATLFLTGKSTGKLMLKAILTDPDDGVREDFVRTLHQGIDITCHVKRVRLSWLEFALHPFPDIFTDQKTAFKVKDALLCEPLTSAQISVIYQYLTGEDAAGMVGLATYGGQVNAVAADATAYGQRKAILTMACMAGWVEAAQEAHCLAWARGCYSDIFAATGGVPPGGCMIAHPDNDLADPVWNTSGRPWYQLYYQDNYERLQRVKAEWDPCNIFRHMLGVEGAVYNAVKP